MNDAGNQAAPQAALASSNDRVPYHSQPFSEAHPTYLGAMGRLHGLDCALPSKCRVLLEVDRFAPECAAALSSHGFEIQPLDPYSFAMGGLQLVTRTADGFVGVGEPRRDSAAGGPRFG